MIFSNYFNLYFTGDEHLDFFTQQSLLLNPDCYLKALIYTLGLCSDTRRRFNSIYIAKERCIAPETLYSAWQTGSSLKVTRLAFQLFTDTTPSAFSHANPDLDECRRYSVSDIFSCGYAPFFAEAIKLRYPEYMTASVVRFSSD